MNFRLHTIFLLAVLGVMAGTAGAWAQEPVPPPTPDYQPLSDQQLDQLLGPIALYPDPLIAEILPASTLPSEIVMADRYLTGGGDPGQIGAQPWDPSVQALAYYPSVLQWMDQNLDWTTELGQAFVNQQQDVMDSVQRLRQSAYNMGNLQSGPQEQVTDDGGEIQIVPADPNELYVPVYQPDQVFYVAAGGVPFITFGAACAIGPWLNCDFDWVHHSVIVWSHDHPRPANWWHEPLQSRAIPHAAVWRPGYRGAPAAVRGGDRGWGAPRQVVTTAPRRVSVPEVRHEAPVVRVPARPAPAVIERTEPVRSEVRSEPNGAFIGGESSRDVRTFSDRGQQSIQAVTHSAPPAPAPRPAPSSGGGGGGERGGRR